MTDIRYTKDHEWARMEGDTAVCGISDYAQKSLGDIVYVELPTIGKKVKQGEPVAVVESAKAASEVYAPIDGEVTAVNDAIVADPAKVNSSPLGEGWFFKIKTSKPSQASGLMDESVYQTHIKELLAG
jgi:glycine cleavage system H protein